MNRRDFLLGNATGLAAGAVATYLGTRSGEAPTKQAAAPVSGPPAPQPVAVNSAQVAYADQHTDKAKTSYAQNGEDLILVQTLKHVLRIDKPDYIDIGAWDPVIGSNTYLLYSQGSRGVVIEPNPAFVDRLRKVRTEDKVLNIGVGLDKKDSVADYYIIEGDGQLNTFSKEQMERHKKRDPNIVKFGRLRRRADGGRLSSRRGRRGIRCRGRSRLRLAVKVVVVLLGHVGGRVLDEADQRLGGFPARGIIQVGRSRVGYQDLDLGALGEVDGLLRLEHAVLVDRLDCHRSLSEFPSAAARPSGVR